MTVHMIIFRAVPMDAISLGLDMQALAINYKHYWSELGTFVTIPLKPFLG